MNHFHITEFDCSCCGANDMQPQALELFDGLRDALGFPLAVSSGYRCANHPLESIKRATGTHSLGVAADFVVRGGQALDLIDAARFLGVERIGVHQRGSGRFVHLDISEQHARPALWTY